MTRYQCEVLESSAIPEWEEFVRRCSRGSIYHSHEYVSLLGYYSNGTARTLVVREGKEILMGVTLFLRRGRGGIYVENRTFLYYNGILGGNRFDSLSESHLREALGVLNERLVSEKLDALTLHSVGASHGGAPDFRPWLGAGWNISPTYTFVLPLADAWKRMDKNLRRLVRRAEEGGFTVTQDSDVESLFRLHHAIHDRKDAPLYLPGEAFIPFVTELLQRKWGKIFHARTSDGVVAASLLIFAGPWKTAHTAVAGSSKEHLASGAAPLVRWKAAEALALEGWTDLDLTDASIESVSRFKRDCGGDLTMNFVMRAPSSLRWRFWEKVQQWR